MWRRQLVPDEHRPPHHTHDANNEDGQCQVQTSQRVATHPCITLRSPDDTLNMLASVSNVSPSSPSPVPVRSLPASCATRDRRRRARRCSRVNVRCGMSSGLKRDVFVLAPRTCPMRSAVAKGWPEHPGMQIEATAPVFQDLET